MLVIQLYTKQVNILVLIEPTFYWENIDNKISISFGLELVLWW